MAHAPTGSMKAVAADGPPASVLAISLALAGPVLLVLVWSLWMRTEVASLAAPILGPWAGHLYGHGDCTLASAMPGWSALAGAVGTLLLIGLSRLRRLLPRAAMVALAAVWSLTWSALALLSVVNTLS